MVGPTATFVPSPALPNLSEDSLQFHDSISGYVLHLAPTACRLFLPQTWPFRVTDPIVLLNFIASEEPVPPRLSSSFVPFYK